MRNIFTKRITVKKTILAPAVALSLGLTGALGFAAAPVLAETGTEDPKPANNDGETTPTPEEGKGSEGGEETDPGTGEDGSSPAPEEGGETDPGADDGSEESGKTTLGTGEDGNSENTENEEESPDETRLRPEASKVDNSRFTVGGMTVHLEKGKPGDTVTFTLYRLYDSSEVTYEEVTGKTLNDEGYAWATLSNNFDESLKWGDLNGDYKVVATTSSGDRYEATFTVYGDKDDDQQPGEGDGTAPPAPGDEENPEQPGDGEGEGGDTENPGDGDDTGEGDGDNQQPGEGEEAPEQPGDGEGEGDDAEEGDDAGDEEEAPAKDPALNLSDKKVTAADFVNKKKGVVATVSGLEPGTKVKFTVTGVSGNAKNVKAYETTATADKDGNAVFSAAGVDKSNPSAYLGKYKVTAEFDDQKLEDSFEVVSGKGSSDADESEETGSGGGSVSGGASDNVSGSTTSGSSDYLPRTGQGLGGLAAGVALLTVGGATVLLTRRTRKA